MRINTVCLHPIAVYIFANKYFKSKIQEIVACGLLGSIMSYSSTPSPRYPSQLYLASLNRSCHGAVLMLFLEVTADCQLALQYGCI